MKAKKRAAGRSSRRNKKNILDNKAVLIIILLLLITGSTFLAIYINEFIGLVISVSSKAGYITSLLVDQRMPTTYWQGFYGLGLMVQNYTDVQYEEAYPGEIESKHLVFDCLQPKIQHEIYASMVHPNLLDWTSIQPATAAMIDDYFNLPPTDTDSAENTFTQSGSVVIGGVNITGVPMTYTKKYGQDGSTVFDLGALNVSGDLVFFTHITSSFQSGFNTQTINYQMIVPAPNETLYYFFPDPNDSCPAGYGTGMLGDGYVTGTVTDNSTGLPLEGVTIGIGSQSNLTDSSGFFNITVAVGYQYIVALKDGYYPHTSLVNITLYDITEHNITMEPFTGISEEQTGVSNGTIEGTVIDNRSNATLENVLIHVGGITRTTDSNGLYNGSLYTGNYTIVGILSGYENHIGSVLIEEETTSVHNISMEPTTGTIQGYAFDNSTGSPIEGVKVSIADQSASTNSSGGYSITVRTGMNFIVGTKTGYENYAENVTIIAGTTIYHNITMAPKAAGVIGIIYENGTVEGYVTDNSTGLPVLNATVSVNGIIGYTNGSGFYSISVLEGAHNIIATKTGYETYTGEVTITADSTVVHNISMGVYQRKHGLNGTIMGVIKDKDTGIYLSGVRVIVGGTSVLSNITGWYKIEEEAGQHYLFAIKADYNNYMAQVNITAGSTLYHNFTMNESITVTLGTGVGPGIGTGTGSGTGIGPGTGVARKVTIIKKVEEYTNYEISLKKIVKKLRVGSFLNVPLSISNFKSDSVNVMFSIEGNVAPMIKLDKKMMNIGAGASEDLTVTLLGNIEPGIYEGNLVISGDIEEEIPISVLLYDKDKLPIEALLIKLRLLEDRVYKGGVLRYRVDIQNMLQEDEYDVKLNYKVINKETKKEFLIDNDELVVHTYFSLLKNFPVPDDFEKGEYLLSLEARYLDLTSTYTSVFYVTEPIYKYAILGIVPLWMVLVVIAGIATGTFLSMLYKKKKSEKERYQMEISSSDLPKAGPRSAFVGNIAETNRRTYFDLDKFQIHTLLAGASGSGKTVAAQVLVEEALSRDVAVIVFDPTATWTGFLRKMQDKKILGMYPQFGMRKSDSKSFNGNVHQVNDGREIIEFKKYMKPKEINIFVTDKLDTNNTEIFVANTIREVFHANLPESPQLKYLLIYDGIHTLLPKFGGSGKVFIQIERATREFRKWGVGLILLSQVLSDFPPQVLANINTEVQMRTRDEGDLKRIKEEYGDSTLKSLVKAGLGSGMVENAAYNKGKPYFITFRPVYHSLERLNAKELENYNKYNMIIDDIEFQLEQLKKEGIDTFDLELELKLAKDKVKSGSFNMVDIYLDGLKPRVKAQWDKIGKKPQKRKVKLADTDEIEQELKEAEKKKKEEGKKEGKAEEKKEEPKAEEKKEEPKAEEKKEEGKAEEKNKSKEEAIDTINSAQKDIKENNISQAKEKYKKIIEIYKTLDKEAKKEIFPKCVELQNGLKGK